MADVFDTAITEGGTWMTVGLNKANTALVITVHLGEDVMYCTGTDLQTLAAAAESLLAP